jgi:hypothetical protein
MRTVGREGHNLDGDTSLYFPVRGVENDFKFLLHTAGLFRICAVAGLLVTRLEHNSAESRGEGQNSVAIATTVWKNLTRDRDRW